MSVVGSIGGFITSHPKVSLGIAAVVLVTAIGSGGNGEVREAASLPETGGSESPAQVEQQAEGVFSFTLEDADHAFSEEIDGGVVVLVEGTSESGAPVSAQYVAVAGQKYDTHLEPGKYTISLANRCASKGSNYFKAAPYSANFDGKSDCDAVLRISLDEEAIAKAEEAKREAEEKAAEEKAAAEKAAAEEAAKKEAEEKAAAEAAAKKEAEEKAAAEAKAAEEKAAAEAAAAKEAEERAAQQESSQKNESTVYVAASGKGECYHSKSSCSGMKKTIEMTRSDAEARGLRPCSKCY